MLTSAEIHELAESLRYSGWLNFTELQNKQAVKRECSRLGIRTFSRTAHGSLLDPRYTVEGRMIPDKGLGNDYRHFTSKLYVLESSRL